MEIDFLKKQIAQKQEHIVSNFINACESPIERKFLLSIIYYYLDVNPHSNLHIDFDGLEDIVIGKAISFSNISGLMGIEKISIKPQVEIEYNDTIWRVDFLLEFHDTKDNVKKMIIECDGHEFHERSIAQVKADNKRFRQLKSLGYELIRYSGSEIHDIKTFDNIKDLVTELHMILDISTGNPTAKSELREIEQGIQVNDEFVANLAAKLKAIGKEMEVVE